MSSGVRGDLLSWARKQQSRTMRWIQNHGGPSASYQCEVEKGRKREVLSVMLSSWVALLDVNEAFARGQISKYHINAADCTGLAADIGALVTAGRSDLPTWAALNERERVRAVFRLIAHESRHLPRVVLAWVLDLQLQTLDAVLVGDHPVMQNHMKAAVDLTGLPGTFFTDEPADGFQQYLPVCRRALELGVTPQTLLSLLERTSLRVVSRGRVRRLHDDRPFGPGDGT